MAFDELLAERDKPLFESLKDLPTATLAVPSALNATASGKRANATLMVTNGSKLCATRQSACGVGGR